MALNKRVFLFIDESHAAAVWRRGRHYFSQEVSDSTSTITERVSALVAQTISEGAPRRANVIIVLCGSLASSRRVVLPPVDTSAAVTLLQSEIHRFFAEPPVRPAVSVLRLSKSRENTTVLAGLADSDSLLQLRRALPKYWRCKHVIPVSACRLALSSAFDQPVDGIITEDWKTAFVRPDGTCREYSFGSSPSTIAAHIAARSTRVGVLLPADHPVHAELLACGISIVEPNAEIGRHDRFVQLAIAATHVQDAELTPAGNPPPGLRRRAARTRRMLVAAGLIAAAQLPIAQFGLQRELNHVRQQRAEITSAVHEAAAAHHALTRLADLQDLVNGALKDAGRTTELLLAIAQNLPTDTHTLSLRASGDSVFLEMSGPSAAAVLKILEADGRMANVRLAGPVRRDNVPGLPPVERFRVLAIAASGASGRT